MHPEPRQIIVPNCRERRPRTLRPLVGLVVPTPIGAKVIECWKNIEKLNDNIFVENFCLMPNHIHGIIVITGQESLEFQKGRYGFESIESLEMKGERRGRRSLQGLIKYFKSVTTRSYKGEVNDPGIKSLWQSSYYDVIIRNEEHYQYVCEYIENNPVRWIEDDYYR